MRLPPHGSHFTAESTEAMRIKCIAQGHNILMPGFELSASVSRNLHYDHMTNMFHILVKVLRLQKLLIYILVISANEVLRILLNVGKKYIYISIYKYVYIYVYKLIYAKLSSMIPYIGIQLIII